MSRCAIICSRAASPSGTPSRVTCSSSGEGAAHAPPGISACSGVDGSGTRKSATSSKSCRCAMSGVANHCVTYSSRGCEPPIPSTPSAAPVAALGTERSSPHPAACASAQGRLPAPRTKCETRLEGVSADACSAWRERRSLHHPRKARSTSKNFTSCIATSSCPCSHQPEGLSSILLPSRPARLPSRPPSLPPSRGDLRPRLGTVLDDVLDEVSDGDGGGATLLCA